MRLHAWRRQSLLPPTEKSAPGSCTTLIAGEPWQPDASAWPVTASGIVFQDVRVSGKLDLTGLRIAFPLVMEDCTFDAIELTNAVTQRVDLSGSTVQRLTAERLRVTGPLLLARGFTARQGIYLVRAEITEDCDFTDSAFRKGEECAIDGNGMTVGKDLILSGTDFLAEGGIDLVGAEIGGQLDCSGATFRNPGGAALSCSGATIAQMILLAEGFRAEGTIDLVGTVIGESLDCSDGEFQAAPGPAISASGIVAKEDVYMSGTFRALGGVDLVGAKITGQVDCEGGRFINPAGIALDGNSMSCSDIFLRAGFHAEGTVDLVAVTVGFNLDCRDGHFDGRDAVDRGALLLRFATIDGSLRFQDNSDRTNIQGVLDLRHAKCAVYGDQPSAWPRAGELKLDGFGYQRFEEYTTTKAERLDWLMRQPPAHLGRPVAGETRKNIVFRPQPWVQCSKVLRDMGYDDDARMLAMSREHMRAKSAGTHWATRLWLTTLRVTIGNGYRPAFVLRWSLGILLAGWLVFNTASSLGFMQPRDKTAAEFNALIYTLDVYLPVTDLGQDRSWQPVTRPTPSCTAPALACTAFTHGVHRLAYWTIQLLGWILVSLFVAGMTGLIKKE